MAERKRSTTKKKRVVKPRAPAPKRAVAATLAEAKPSEKTGIVVKIKRLFRHRSPAVKRGATGARMLQAPERLWYNPLTWQHRPPAPSYRPLPKARKLFKTMLVQLWQHRKLFGGIILIYGILNFILVRSLSGSSSLATLKGSLDGVFHGVGGKIFGSTISFTYLLATSGSGNTNTSGVYQGLLLFTCSLAFIWALRQVIAKHTVRIRDSFYLGMYPIVPFLLIFLLLCVQLLPLAVGGSIFTVILSNNIAVNLWEKTVAFMVFLGLGLWSLRMVTASIFALYIVTLPEMTPLRAYRSGRQLVYRRRLHIWRKLIFLPIVMLLASAAIELPLIYFVTPVAAWVFFVISMLGLPIVHGYLYNLYREML